jgi:hypothetical protein
MTRRTFVAALTFAIAAQMAPKAERTPHAAAPAWTNDQRHHYTIGGRVRPLVFWVGRDDVGDAVITRRRESDSASYALLIGSDPERAPRSINRWGYISEEVRGTDATLLGLMTESDEESVNQAEANLRNRGDRTFNVIHAEVAGGEARSVVRSVAAPSTLTLRQVDTVLELADRSGSNGETRVVRVPAGGRPGFLTAVADVMHAQATDWRWTGKVHPSDVVPYVYHGKTYQLRSTHARAVGSALIGANTYDHLIESQFQIKNVATGALTVFSLTYAADGPLAEIPVSATYQPRWWIQIQLTLDDTKPGPPLPPAEITR